MNYHKKGF